MIIHTHGIVNLLSWKRTHSQWTLCWSTDNEISVPFHDNNFFFLSSFQRRSSTLLIREVIVPYLTGKLAHACHGHCSIHAGEVPVYRCDDHAPPCPNYSTASHNNLLRVGYHFRRFGKVSNIGNTDTPFECWGPEMNCNKDQMEASTVQMTVIEYVKCFIQ